MALLFSTSVMLVETLLVGKTLTSVAVVHTNALSIVSSVTSLW